MEQVKDINLKIISKYILHQEIFPSNMLPDTNADGDEQGQVTFGYDYEIFPDNRWHFHADTSIRIVPFAQVSTRTTFEIYGTAAELFSTGVMKPLIKSAFDTLAEQFDLLIRAHEFAVDNIPVKGKMLDNFVANAIHAYYQYGRQLDIDNAAMKNMEGMHFSMGPRTALILKGTCMIMDHLMYENPEFDLLHNREAVNKHLLIPCYETLKFKCIQIDKQPVQLSWFHTILLFICTDCALQVLLGPHADTLTAGLQQRGWNEEVNQQFITYCSEMLSSTKQKMKEGGMTVATLDDVIDWNSLIR